MHHGGSMAAAAALQQQQPRCLAPPCRRVRRQRRWSCLAEQQQQQADVPYSDPLARQRAQLGDRVVRHLAGEPVSGGGACRVVANVPRHFPACVCVSLPCHRILAASSEAQCADLQSAVHVLPVRVQPPRAWHTLTDGVAARGVAALRAALAPRPRRIPSFPECRCTLASSPVGWRFRDRRLNLFLALLFESIPSAAALAGLPPISLSRFDLHHGHLFYAASCRQLGLLMHGEWECRG